MADPKYENLPGIAYDQPDVYESGDLPEADQSDDITDDENDCIEKLHLSVKDSFEKFKGKHVTGNVDFSDRLSRKVRTGYRSGDWELAGEEDMETPFQRYQRLKCEMSELLEQIVEQQTKTPEDDKAELKKLVEQVTVTKRVLEGLNIKEDGSGSDGENILDLLSKMGDQTKHSSKGTAHIKIKPDQFSLQQSTRIAQLEHRLHSLEKAAGIRDEESLRKIKAATGETTLCAAAALLATQASMLRPADVAAAETRVASLLSNMDTLKAATGIDPERTKKINELYDTLKKIEGISHIEILERMEALESLHNQASNFGKSLSELEAMQSSISSSVNTNKSVLQGVQEIFLHSLEQIKVEVDKLEERIDKMTKP